MDEKVGSLLPLVVLSKGCNVLEIFQIQCYCARNKFNLKLCKLHSCQWEKKFDLEKGGKEIASKKIFNKLLK